MRQLLLLFTLAFLITLNINGQEKDRIRVHDPVMIQEDGTWYLFSTGWGISVYSSTDLQNWNKLSPVLEETPEWINEEIPEFKGRHLWAPDVFYHDGLYYLYYSASVFGRNTSCIGVVTNKTLNPEAPEYKWTDHGKVIQSEPGKTNWNAIDPNIIIDQSRQPWMSFGSFWGGIQLIELEPDLLDIKGERENSKTIASRISAKQLSDIAPGERFPTNSIEAPFIFRKGNYYYLFVSWDKCCSGPESTYKVAMGRSKNIEGPYVDKNGKPLLFGGGTIMLQGDDTDWYAQGHNAVVRDESSGKVYMVTHAYDRHHERGVSRLRILEMNWKDGWPVIGKEVY